MVSVDMCFFLFALLAKNDSMVRQRGTFAGQTRSSNVMCAIALPATDSSQARFLVGLESGFACIVEGRQVVQVRACRVKMLLWLGFHCLVDGLGRQPNFTKVQSAARCS